MVRGFNSIALGFASRGPSFNVNPNNSAVINFGGAYKILNLPSGLIFNQQGNDAGHFELLPVNDMLESTYLSLLGQIQTEASF